MFLSVSAGFLVEDEVLLVALDGVFFYALVYLVNCTKKKENEH